MWSFWVSLIKEHSLRISNSHITSQNEPLDNGFMESGHSNTKDQTMVLTILFYPPTHSLVVIARQGTEAYTGMTGLEFINKSYVFCFQNSNFFSCHYHYRKSFNAVMSIFNTCQKLYSDNILLPSPLFLQKLFICQATASLWGRIRITFTWWLFFLRKCEGLWDGTDKWNLLHNNFRKNKTKKKAKNYKQNEQGTDWKALFIKFSSEFLAHIKNITVVGPTIIMYYIADIFHLTDVVVKLTKGYLWNFCCIPQH